MKHEALQGLLPLYALGVLGPEEQGAVLAHLATACAPCAEELRTLQGAVDGLGYSVAPVQPPERVRESILRFAQERPERASDHAAGADPVQVWRSWPVAEPATGLNLVRAGEGAWEEALAGVQVKRLSYDPDHRVTTMLIRMRAGTSYPSHRHATAEECYVIEGDLHVGDELVMHTGDFQRAERASVHPPQWTEDGCLLFVTSSLEDELLA